MGDQSTRATVKSRTSAAPAARSARAQARAVAPVVKTSSTSTITRPATRDRWRTAKAPVTFARRGPRSGRSGWRCRCAAPAARRDGDARRAAPARAASSSDWLKPRSPASARMQGHRHQHVGAPQHRAHPRLVVEALREPGRGPAAAAVLQLVDGHPQRPLVGPQAGPAREGGEARGGNGRRSGVRRQQGHAAAAARRRGGGAASPSSRRTAARGAGWSSGRPAGRAARGEDDGQHGIDEQPRGRGQASGPRVRTFTGGPAPASPGRRGSAWPTAPPPGASCPSRPRRPRTTPKLAVVDAHEGLVHELRACRARCWRG